MGCMAFVPLDKSCEVVHVVSNGHGGVVVTQAASLLPQVTEVCFVDVENCKCNEQKSRRRLEVK